MSRTFGCVRKVDNLALAARTEAWARQERVNHNATSAMPTAWKKTEELAFLNDVSSVPLQQTLRHLQTAFTHFFAKRAKYPRFHERQRRDIMPGGLGRTAARGDAPRRPSCRRRKLIGTCF
ncbi:hypothetical protein AQJ91_10030 [Streptomyces dysideae]|uniref:Transposase putative helix-turn-helix domain-containing protein n=1 Tax=Streptomyces dysideae TaxID=909626 RepID=A0A101V2I9_9ACTN|nr:hypothetical protein AQJ91_10030 [Streptomyces dysideae]